MTVHKEERVQKILAVNDRHSHVDKIDRLCLAGDYLLSQLADADLLPSQCQLPLPFYGN